MVPFAACFAALVRIVEDQREGYRRLVGEISRRLCGRDVDVGAKALLRARSNGFKELFGVISRRVVGVVEDVLSRGHRRDATGGDLPG